MNWPGFRIGNSLQGKIWLNVFRVETSQHSIFNFYMDLWMIRFVFLIWYFGPPSIFFFFLRNAIHLNLFSRAGVSSGWVNHEVSLLSKFKCSNLQIIKCSNDQMFKCSNVLMLKWSNGPMLECLDIQMFNCFGYSQGFFFKNAMHFNSFSGAGVSSGWVNHKVRLISRYFEPKKTVIPRISNVHMFQCSDVQMFRCSNVQMNKCSNVQVFQWSNARMFRYSNVQLLWLFSRFFLQKCYVFQLVLGGRCVFSWG